MGSNFANDLANTDLGIDLETQIKIHLTGNHYPPVPTSMVKPCIEAIEAYNEGDTHKMISLPEPITWRDKTEAPAYAIIEAHHLDAWIAHDEYCYCDECVPVGDSAEYPLENDL